MVSLLKVSLTKKSVQSVLTDIETYVASEESQDTGQTINSIDQKLQQLISEVSSLYNKTAQDKSNFYDQKSKSLVDMYDYVSGLYNDDTRIQCSSLFFAEGHQYWNKYCKSHVSLLYGIQSTDNNHMKDNQMLPYPVDRNKNLTITEFMHWLIKEDAKVTIVESENGSDNFTFVKLLASSFYDEFSNKIPSQRTSSTYEFDMLYYLHYENRNSFFLIPSKKTRFYVRSMS